MYKHENYLKELKRRMKPGKTNIIQLDNAHPHISRKTQPALDGLGLKSLLHPSYSPHIAPCDFFVLSPKLKEHLKGKYYKKKKNDDATESDVRSWSRDRDAGLYANGIRQLV